MLRQGSLSAMAQVTLRLFASARVAAGVGRAAFEAGTVGEVLDLAKERYGAEFVAVLSTCRIWRNGQPAQRCEETVAGDEVAVLPPVSGG